MSAPVLTKGARERLRGLAAFFNTYCSGLGSPVQRIADKARARKNNAAAINAALDYIDALEGSLRVMDSGCDKQHERIDALEAERDALRLRVAALEAALLGWKAWTGGDDCLPKLAAMSDAALSGEPTALRAMLVEAAQFGFKDGRDYEALSTEAALSWPKHDVWCDAICDRILGTDKGGGE